MGVLAQHANLGLAGATTTAECTNWMRQECGQTQATQGRYNAVACMPLRPDLTCAASAQSGLWMRGLTGKGATMQAVEQPQFTRA